MFKKLAILCHVILLGGFYLSVPVVAGKMERNGEKPGLTVPTDQVSAERRYDRPSKPSAELQAANAERTQTAAQSAPALNPRAHRNGTTAMHR